MRVKRCYTKCALRLTAGEVKRIPVRNLLILTGYYVGCPSCNRSMTVSAVRAPIIEEGTGPGETPLLSLGPVTCESCGVVFQILRDEVSLVPR